MFKNCNLIRWKHYTSTKPDPSKTTFEAHLVVVEFHPSTALNTLAYPPPLCIIALSASGIVFWSLPTGEMFCSLMHSIRINLNTANSHGLRSRNRLCCMMPSTENQTKESLCNFWKHKQHAHTYSSTSAFDLGGGSASGCSSASAGFPGSGGSCS